MALPVAVWTSTICSLVNTVVATVTMRKVAHLPFDWSTLCLSLFNPAPCTAAHSGVVRGVATDTLNQLTMSCGSDWLLKFWRFKTRKQDVTLKLSAAAAIMKLHRDR